MSRAQPLPVALCRTTLVSSFESFAIMRLSGASTFFLCQPSSSFSFSPVSFLSLFHVPSCLLISLFLGFRFDSLRFQSGTEKDTSSTNSCLYDQLRNTACTRKNVFEILIGRLMEFKLGVYAFCLFYSIIRFFFILRRKIISLSVLT